MGGTTGLELSILITAHDAASRVIGLIGGAFGGLKTGLSEIAFGLRNLGTAGTVGTDALMQGFAGMGKSLLLLGGLLAVVGIAAAAYLGYQGVKAAADFQQGLNRLITGAGDTTDNMAKMGRSILGVSVDTGVAAGDLNKAMYLIISSGQRGAQALDTLSVASKGAVIEQANVADVANVVSGLMTNYGTKTYNATQYMNGMIAAVKQGKVSLQDLAVAMGPIDPIAKQMGISVNDVAAAMTTQTNAMVPAARAATGLRFLMQSLENPTHKATAAMNKYGLDTVAVANEMKVSLPGAFQMIYKAALRAGPEGSVPFNRALSDMVGGVRSFTAYTALTGSHMKDFIKNSEAIKAAMIANRNAVIGWDTAQSGFNVKMDKAKAAMEALLITIGTALLPVLSRLLDMVLPVIVSFTQWVIESHIVENVIGTLVDAIGWLINTGAAIVDFFQHNELAMDLLKGALITAAGIIGGLMVVALISMASAAWIAAAGMIALYWPIYLTIAIVIALVAAVIYLYNHWTAFRNAIIWLEKAFVSLWGWIKNNIMPVLKEVWSWIQNSLIPALGNLWDWVQNNVVAAFAALWDWIQNSVIPALASLWDWLQNNVVPVLASLWDWIQNSLIPALGNLWDWIQNYVISSLASLWNFLTTKIFPVLQGWYNKVVDVINSIKQWNDKNDALHKAIGFVRDILGKVNDFINNQIKPTFNDIKNKINNDLIPAFNGIVTAVKPLVDKYLSALNGALGTIGQAIQTLNPYFDTLKKDFQEIGKMLQPFLPLLQTLASYWWIVLLPLAAVVFEMGLFALAVGGLIVTLTKTVGGIATFVTGVVQMFSGLVQQVSGYLQVLDDVIHGKFDKIGKDMKTESDGYNLTWSGAWNVIQGIWYAGMGSIIAGATWFDTTIFNIFVDLYNKLVGHSIVPNTVNAIINWFALMATRGTSSAGDLVSGVTGKLGQLPMIAYNAGLSVSTGIASGITSGIGAAIKAAQNLAAQVASFLPHSPAKQGPLRDLNKFGPALVTGFSEGIIRSVPQMQHAMNLMLAPAQMSSGHLVPTATTRGGSGQVINNFNVSLKIERINEFGSNMPREVGLQITNVVEKELSRRYRGQWNNASGGVT